MPPARNDDSADPAGLAELGERLQAELGISVSALGEGKITSWGDLRSGSAWSTIKVVIALQILEDAGGPAGLDSKRRQLIEAALTASDNAATARLHERLMAGHGGVGGTALKLTDMLREAGDAQTTVATQTRGEFSSYGQTEWSLPEQTRFIAALAGGRLAQAPCRNHVLALMGQVRSDLWGLGSAGVPARWKGGWGPGTDGRYLLRQMGVIEIGGASRAVALAVRPGDGGFASGRRAATAVAQWLAGTVPPHSPAWPAGSGTHPRGPG